MDSAAEGNDSPVKGHEMASSEEMEPLTPTGGSGSPKTTPTRHFEQGKPYSNSKVLNWSPNFYNKILVKFDICKDELCYVGPRLRWWYN